MFLTLTLPSYGRVRDGVPVNPDTYDYRRAALDALLFPRLLDRFWQNLRRCAAYKVQYFSAVEAQRRLAPHLHAAVRGAIPRATLRAVVRATYYAAWWPSVDRVVYADERVPVWHSGFWAVCRPGHRGSATHLGASRRRARRTGACGVLRHPAGHQRHPRRIRSSPRGRCATCASTSPRASPAPTPTVRTPTTPQRRQMSDVDRHIDRLHEHIRWLPCSPACANWLRYGVQPANAGPGLAPGRCPCPAHERENLGLGGRRVLVSRAWTGKTLADHRADRRAVVTQVLEAAGIPTEDAARLAAHHRMPDGQTPLRLDGRARRRTGLRDGHDRLHPPRPAAPRAVRDRQGPPHQARATRRRPCGQPFGNPPRGMSRRRPWTKRSAARAGRLRPQGKRHLTVAELCHELGVARSTFYDWRAKGAAPRCFKLPNGELRIRRADLDAWLSSLGDGAA